MPVPLNITAPSYDALIGTGGIGTGIFFALTGEHTLGREESRGGRLLDRRDYCKLHIIAHTVRVLVGHSMTVLPVSRVGDDDAGRHLRAEMSAAGIDFRYVETGPGEQTLFSFCLIYPDGSGGNLTTDDSACARVDAAYVRRAEIDLQRFGARAIALAVPEVPLEARAAMLDMATRYGAWRVASFTSGEVTAAMREGLISLVDLLALNLDEAAVAAELRADGASADDIARAAYARLSTVNPGLRLTVTAGRRGSWISEGGVLFHHPIFNGPVRGTAGAGDAFLSGVLAGFTANLSAVEAQQLGALTAGLAITSPHTIHPELDRNSLRRFAEETRATVSDRVWQLLAKT